MIVYISGAISNDTNYKYNFEKAEMFLKLIGHKVVNPAKIELPFDYIKYMRLDFKLIELCDAIFMIHGWQNSNGAISELSFAKSIGKKVMCQGYYNRRKQNYNF